MAKERYLLKDVFDTFEHYLQDAMIEYKTEIKSLEDRLTKLSKDLDQRISVLEIKLQSLAGSLKKFSFDFEKSQAAQTKRDSYILASGIILSIAVIFSGDGSKSIAEVLIDLIKKLIL